MITTLLDNDFYAFTMSALVTETGLGDTQVGYKFRNRSFAVPLASRLDLGEVQEMIEQVRSLSFTNDELDYLQSLGYFDTEQIAVWSYLKLPEVELRSDHGHLVMEYEGPWESAIFWETPLLSIVNELYFRQFGVACHPEGNLRLREKIEYLGARKTLRFAEFGTRRRFSGLWQQHVLDHMLREVPELVLGTSNVHLARYFGISPVGTMAHQLFMVQAALQAKEERQRVPGDWPNLAIENATRWVVDEWAKLYAPNLMCALSDTFTTGRFFDAGPDLVPYTMFRQDSGDPILAGEAILDGYHQLTRRDPKDITVFFSDGLDVRRMSIIEDHFKDLCQYAFGWGTNLTNDLGVEPLAIVIKPDRANGEPCIKLSDDISKATGDPKVIAAYKEAIEQ